MSYEIIYDKQFVKVSDKVFIPMILAGSNNCYEHTYKGERRARNWFNFSFILMSGLAGSMEEMLKFQEGIRSKKLEQYPDEYKDSSFGYYTGLSNRGGGCNMTYGQYTGIVKTGCKKALTIEQLLDEGVTINITTSRSAEEKLKSLGLEPLNFTPRSTQELADFLIGTAPKYMPLTHLNATYTGMFDEKPTRIRKRFFPKVKKEKKKVTSTTGFAIETPVGYFSKGTRSGYLYSPSKTGGKQYLNKKEAERKAKALNKRYGKEFKVIEVEYGYEKTFYV
jgi:hypothetical protein